MAPKTTFVEEAVSRAESHVRKGELDRACEFYQAVLAKYPNNKRALDGLRAVRSKIGNVGRHCDER